MNDAMIVNCVAYANGHKLPHLTLENVPALLRDPADAFVWLGLREPDEELMARIQDLFGLHELAAEEPGIAISLKGRRSPQGIGH